MMKKKKKKKELWEVLGGEDAASGLLGIGLSVDGEKLHCVYICVYMLVLLNCIFAVFFLVLVNRYYFNA